MDLELEAQETSVGPFRADILCRDTGSDDSMVLIENQLETTDHKHLGQLMTYAAGLHAVTIVWIAAKFTDEHRASMNWLNDITDDSFRFFGLEVELWRIGDSPAAPKFNVVAKPNDWSRSVSKAARQIEEGELSETKALYLRYWASLRDYLDKKNTPLRLQAAGPKHWHNFSIGRSGYKLATLASVQSKWIGVELYIRRDPDGVCIEQLLAEKEEIESSIDETLDWRKLPNRIASRVVLQKQNTNPSNDEAWEKQFEWFDRVLRGFNDAFRERVRHLDPEVDHFEYEENGEEDNQDE
jgi:hypothetical protein